MIGLLAKEAFAKPPLTNLEGVGGIAFNPLAYLADSGSTDDYLKIKDIDFLTNPRIGVWYVSLSDVNVDWTSIGVADTFLKKLEVSYGFETINQENATVKHKNNLGAKLLVLKENSFDTNFLPSVSLGTIFKHTSNVGAGVDTRGWDYYLVATKSVNFFPRPILLSAGLLSSKGKTTGVFGYDKDRDITGFANIDVVLPKNLILGFEYKEGSSYSDWKDADYWETHLAWTPNDNLTLVLAYVDAGDSKSASKVGLGNGVVLSVQYAF